MPFGATAQEFEEFGRRDVPTKVIPQALIIRFMKDMNRTKRTKVSLSDRQ